MISEEKSETKFPNRCHPWSSGCLWCTDLCEGAGWGKGTLNRRTQRPLEWKGGAAHSVESSSDPGWGHFWSRELWCFRFCGKAGGTFQVPAERSQKRVLTVSRWEEEEMLGLWRWPLSQIHQEEYFSPNLYVKGLHMEIYIWRTLNPLSLAECFS